MENQCLCSSISLLQKPFKFSERMFEEHLKFNLPFSWLQLHIRLALAHGFSRESSTIFWIAMLKTAFWEVQYVMINICKHFQLVKDGTSGNNYLRCQVKTKKDGSVSITDAESCYKQYGNNKQHFKKSSNNSNETWRHKQASHTFSVLLFNQLSLYKQYSREFFYLSINCITISRSFGVLPYVATHTTKFPNSSPDKVVFSKKTAALQASRIVNMKAK